ncbi:hypothetical protein F5148DRAFT_752870 [Russula earlei]|uniref:Uncharacterized protein n=1 Tax=Russula earlei TaxID=71964 RepID=A0ACC0TTU8_9AGAM|nr:hypothetical protein F5148DRAFT_752870 [Russula earlei]
MNSDNLHHQDSSPISTWAIPTARPFQVSVIAPHDQETSGQECNQRKMTINMLSNDVLMEIFDFYANGCDARINEWHTLLHVCRRWRYTVFAFPRHLNLRMEYVGQGRRYISEMLDAWPVLPLVMTCRDWEPLRRIHSSCAKIISALESRHHDRICEICFYDIPEPHLKNVVAAMWRPFPELRRLRLGGDNVVAAIPNSFLGGSAPCLRELEVDWIGFRGMKNLLLSANNLVTLSLWSIPTLVISPCNDGDLPLRVAQAQRLQTWIPLSSILTKRTIPIRSFAQPFPLSPRLRSKVLTST